MDYFLLEEMSGILRLKRPLTNARDQYRVRGHRGKGLSVEGVWENGLVDTRIKQGTCWLEDVGIELFGHEKYGQGGPECVKSSQWVKIG